MGSVSYRMLAVRERGKYNESVRPCLPQRDTEIVRREREKGRERDLGLLSVAREGSAPAEAAPRIEQKGRC